MYTGLYYSPMNIRIRYAPKRMVQWLECPCLDYSASDHGCRQEFILRVAKI